MVTESVGRDRGVGARRADRCRRRSPGPRALRRRGRGRGRRAPETALARARRPGGGRVRGHGDHRLERRHRRGPRPRARARRRPDLARGCDRRVLDGGLDLRASALHRKLRRRHRAAADRVLQRSRSRRGLPPRAGRQHPSLARASRRPARRAPARIGRAAARRRTSSRRGTCRSPASRLRAARPFPSSCVASTARCVSSDGCPWPARAELERPEAGVASGGHAVVVETGAGAGPRGRRRLRLRRLHGSRDRGRRPARAPGRGPLPHRRVVARRGRGALRCAAASTASGRSTRSSSPRSCW